MKNSIRLPMLAIAAAMAYSCGNAERGDRDAASTQVIDSISDTTERAQAMTADIDLPGDEKTFINAAATGGLMEVEAGKAALTISKNESVRKFAEMMVRDHTKANAELATIASKLGIQLPTSLPKDKQAHLKGMQSLNDKKFDEQYMLMMIKDHSATVKLFTEGARLSDANVKSFASKTLPVLTAHYNEALKIGKTMNLNNSGNGDDPQGMSPAPGHTN
ncbi:DUF4142 domain-containing protein [Pedobacter deserti]|uniref:DUF4142 domain-containing protein n=1 Tax=Pedobacter deserti TaxID=2817382 RepID=UPI002109C51A|nr:DUF4142 domain-containing protein [Pedobacter sp. SYSU D00382]